MKFAASLIVAIATVAASNVNAACWSRSNPSVKFASVQGADLRAELNLSTVEVDQEYCNRTERLDVYKSSADAKTAVMCVRGKAAQRELCGSEVACCATAKFTDVAVAAAPIPPPVAASADAAQAVAATCWTRSNPSVTFASVQGVDLRAEFKLNTVEVDQTYCNKAERLDIYKSSADAKTAMMCVRGKEAQRKFCGGNAVACCAAAKLTDVVATATPTPPPVAASANAAQAVASVPAPPVVANAAQAVASVPAPPVVANAAQAATLAPAPLVIAAPVEEATRPPTAPVPAAAAAGSNGAQAARAGCWKPLSDVVNFASLAGVNLSSDAGLTNVLTDNALCESKTRVDVNTSTGNDKFGMVCVRGKEAQRKRCGAEVACCVPGVFVSA